MLMILTLSATCSLQPAQAQTFTVLHSFMGKPDGRQPFGALLNLNARLYGTTESGGASNQGTIFELSPKGGQFVLRSFVGLPRGAYPYAGLVSDAEGNLYGTTESGGASKLGTVFKGDTSGHETVLHTFTGGSDGAYPYAGLTLDSAGNLYGTTELGGASNLGTVFKLDAVGNETVLHSFSGADGANPSFGSLLIDAAGNIFGTTSLGGDLNCNASRGCGTVFEVETNGNETVLHSFTGMDGRFPQSTLVRDKYGNLYGTAEMGGNVVCDSGVGCGLVFKLDTVGNETVLYRFSAVDGAFPIAGLTPDGEGNFFGTTYGGGAYGYGTVFKLSKQGKETVLHSFDGLTDGAQPYARLVRDDEGNLYGTAEAGGAGARGAGTVFMIVP